MKKIFFCTGVLSLLFLASSFFATPLFAQIIAPVAPVWEEKNRLLVIEVESMPVVESWKKETTLTGFTGSSYYTWRGTPNTSTTTRTGTIAYKFYVNNAGTYNFRIRNRHDNANALIENDVFVKLDSGAWQKVFSATGGSWTWDTKFDLGTTRPSASYTLSAGEHTLYVSAKSANFSIDRLVLFQEGVIGQSTTLPESPIKVYTSTPTPTSIARLTPTPSATATSTPIPSSRPTPIPSSRPSVSPSPRPTQTVPPSSPIIGIDACVADINQDGIVDIEDYSIVVIAENFLATTPANIKADTNKDGIVDVSDVSYLQAVFLQGCARSSTPQPSSRASSSPQPSASSRATSTPQASIIGGPVPTATSLISIKATDLDYAGTNYFVDAQLKWLGVKAGNPPALASAIIFFPFSGQTGVYTIKLYGVGEADGQSKYEVLLNNQVIGNFTAPVSTNSLEEGEKYNLTLPKISLKNNDTISVRAYTATVNNVDFSRGRWSKIDFTVTQ